MDPSSLAYIPNYWYEKAVSLSNPGMIHSSNLICKHGRIKPSYYDCFSGKGRGSESLNMSTMNTSSMGTDQSMLGERSFVLNLADVED